MVRRNRFAVRKVLGFDVELGNPSRWRKATHWYVEDQSTGEDVHYWSTRKGAEENARALNADPNAGRKRLVRAKR